MEPWVWAVLLFLLAMSLAMLEVFLPSGGILGFLSVCSVIGALVLAFRSGPTAGLAILAATIVGTPLAIMAALKVWPHTPIGRRVMLGVPTADEVLPDSPRQRALRELIGHTGKARSAMLPSGAVLVDGRTIDAVSMGVAIEAGQAVRVIDVRGNRVLVRPLDDDQEVAEPRADDPLSQPIESLGIEPLDDPPPAAGPSAGA